MSYKRKRKTAAKKKRTYRAKSNPVTDWIPASAARIVKRGRRFFLQVKKKK